MYPIFFKIGSLIIHTYGVFIALAFLIAVILASSKAAYFKLSREAVLDVAFWILLGVLLGARILEVVTNLGYYKADWLRVIKIWEGGLSFFGGLTGGLLGGIIYIRKKQMSVWDVGDLFGPYIALGQAIGRIGCFAAGCCYGRISHSFCAVTFNNPQSLAPLGIGLHPVQLYESLADFLVFLALIYVTRHRKFRGQVFLLYFILYAIVRFIVEFYRGDNLPIVGIFTLYQLISAVVLISALTVYLYQWKKQRNIQQK